MDIREQFYKESKRDWVYENNGMVEVAYVQWLEQRLEAGQHETLVMVPYLLNRADAVDGHYCIARVTAEGFTEFWNDKLNKWCATATVFELGKAP